MPARHRLGSLDLLILSDGTYYQDAGAVFGIVPKLLWERLGIPLNDKHQMGLALNSLLLRSEGKTVLIETGVGEKDRPRQQSSPLAGGNLLDDLAAAGVAVEDVDVVINTHLHADHCGWNTRRAADGSYVPTFPRARYMVQRGEWEAAMHPNERTRAAYLAENLSPLEAAGCVELFDGEKRVTDDLTLIPTPGHAQGDVAVVLSSAGERAVYTGDMAQHHAQLERLPWVSSFDLFPATSMETKRVLLGRAARDSDLLATAHCGFPGLGRISDAGAARWKWTPVTPNDSERQERS